MQTGIHIDGSSNIKDAAKPLADAIISIMAANAEQETIRHALTVFQQGVSINYATVSNCTIDARSIEPYPTR